MKPKNLKSVGDKIWVIEYAYGIAIRCTIEEVCAGIFPFDPDSKMSWPKGAMPFYWVDEPIGHAINHLDFVKTKKEAIGILEEYEPKKGITLKQYRKKRIDFIRSTGNKRIDEFAKTYKDKKEGVDWVRLAK